MPNDKSALLCLDCINNTTYGEHLLYFPKSGILVVASLAQRLKHLPASACNVGDLGLIPGSGRSPGEGNGNPLQYSCLENPMDGGAWWATVHGVAESWTRLSDFTFRQKVPRWQLSIEG